MLTQTAGIIDVGTITWQPRFDCTVSCSGCYVGEAKAAQYNGPLKDQILKLIFEDKKVRCYQFTISLDTTPNKNEELVETLKSLWESYPLDPELCVTVHDWNTALSWADAMGLTPEKFLEPIGMLSISRFPSLGKICKEVRDLCDRCSTELNFNCTVDQHTIGNKRFEMGVRYAHMTYLVLKKNPLGQPQDPQAIQNWFQARKLVPQNELVEDTCMQDSALRLKTGGAEGCGGGISKLNIWPNGLVTGCPYDSQNVISLSESDEYNIWDELNRVKDNKENYCMDRCRIHEVLAPIPEVKQQVIDVQNDIVNP